MTDDQIVAQMDTVKRVALRMYYKTRGRVELEELTSVGYLALLGACDTYRDTEGATLATWVSLRVSGAMIDYMRRHDPLSRGHRKLIGSVRMTEQFVAEDSVEPGCRVSEAVSHFVSPFDMLLRCEIVEILSRYPTRKEWYRQVMIAYWLEELGMAEIGLRFDCTVSRVSQIASAELVKVRMYVIGNEGEKWTGNRKRHR